VLLKDHQVFEKLKEFNPILIGTIPINIAVEESDLDIACEVYDLIEFERKCQERFGNHKEYAFKIKTVREKEVGIANFKIVDMPIEIYAESRPVFDQNGYRHMIIEHKILEYFGLKFREEIIKLKSRGLKTEPSFSKLLNLAGDPYESLLSYNI